MSPAKGQHVRVRDDTRKHIAGEVRAEMARQQKKQDELGEVLGLPQQAISPRVRGERSFRAEELAALAAWLDVPLERFMPTQARVA